MSFNYARKSEKVCEDLIGRRIEYKGKSGVLTQGINTLDYDYPVIDETDLLMCSFGVCKTCLNKALKNIKHEKCMYISLLFFLEKK